MSREVKRGNRAVMFYLLNRGDVESVGPARSIDPDYAHALEKAIKQGVEVLVYQTQITSKGITVKRKVPFVL